MTDIAFQGDPAVKDMALARLRRHIADGSFVFYPAWEEGKANVIGAIVEADDQTAFAERLGYPIALVTALESIVNAYQTLPVAQTYVTDWFEQTPVGADLSRVVSQVLLSILERSDLVTLTAPHAELERCRQAVIALHRREIDGDAADRKGWKVERLAAVAASDAITDGSFAHLAGLIVEAAAWPATMRTVLSDTLDACGRLELRRETGAIGWTEALESRAYKIREKAEIDGRMAELSGIDRMLGLLDAEDPELGQHFRQRLECFERLGHINRLVGRQIVELMRQAPVVATPAEASA
ncbi:hypothetical protein EWE75_05490 [Sphingomonas populi]|uniref:Uncharacterized protein n=1 Tax=Sphingomonas populi TaxID=2484750 RepID=A0A4Q6Y4Z7_9SPHN|nr:hypothetical protein [Sphingomonas populi]RZF65422.1 hypothetical protein EWE75_05490 [Sphingomonas populi]